MACFTRKAHMNCLRLMTYLPQVRMRSLGVGAGAFGDAFLLLTDENDEPARVPLSADAEVTDVESGITDVMTDVEYDVVTILPRNASTLQVF